MLFSFLISIVQNSLKVSIVNSSKALELEEARSSNKILSPPLKRDAVTLQPEYRESLLQLNYL